ncbi:hypothetical protein O6H91_Y426000 [Diphasiastrum complanatum]|nr:hypothetical protein O6H91_Y426000 [Diphasiastrum complanatum]
MVSFEEIVIHLGILNCLLKSLRLPRYDLFRELYDQALKKSSPLLIIIYGESEHGLSIIGQILGKGAVFHPELFPKPPITIFLILGKMFLLKESLKLFPSLGLVAVFG